MSPKISRRLVRLAFAGSAPDIVLPPTSGQTITLLDLDKIPDEIAFLRVSVRASHDSAANGLTFESTLDGGTNFDTVQAGSSYVAANGLLTFDAPRVGTRMRIRYANSANTLTAWRGEIRALFAKVT